LLELPAVLLAITLHEYAHGVVAARLGDPTGGRAGRLSVDPWAHIDWLGLAALVLVGFGWAKPMPVDPRYFRNPRRGMMWTALAGPAMNLVLALAAAVAATVWTRMAGVPATGTAYYLFVMLRMAVPLNLAFGVFNLLVVPPLDGSRVLAGLLPPAGARWLYRLEPYGMWILLALVLTPLAGWLLLPVMALMDHLFQGVAVWLTQWLPSLR
jgi:Zn-dependent protease